MKKIFAVLIVCILLFNTLSFAKETFNVCIESPDAAPGEIVEVNVYLENNPGVLAMHFDMEYDTSKLKLIECVDCGLLKGPVFSQNKTDYPYVMLWNSASSENIKEDGNLVKLTFKILDDAKQGDAYIRLNYEKDNIYDVDLKNIDVNVLSGNIYVINGSKTDKKVHSSGSVTNHENEPNTDKVETNSLELPYKDVSETDWFYNSVKYVSEKKLMNGVSNMLFAPDEYVTRAMFITVLYRIEDEPQAQESDFYDVQPGSWYADAVSWAYANDIVRGVSKDSFAPKQLITREQMATVLYRYDKYKGNNPTVNDNLLINYNDFSSVSQYATNALNWAIFKKMISGKTSKTLNPCDNATRAEMSAVIMRFMQK